jgi:alkaline phosphatase D
MKMKLSVILIFYITAIYGQLSVGPFAGAVTENSAEFIIKTFKPEKVVIELFEENDLESTIFSSEEVADTNNYNYVKLSAKGLKPNTTYHYRAIVNEVRSRRWHSFKTFPSEKRTNFSFGFGSCQQSSYAKWTPEVFPVAANDSLRFFIQIGDWTYPDTTEKKYGYRFNEKMDLVEKSYQSKYDYNYPFTSEILSQMPIAYVYDDHDFAANNPDGTTPAKENSIIGYRKFFPHYPLKNENNGIWQSFRFGDAEFFLLDTRAQRSPNINSLGEDGIIIMPPGHSLLAGFDIEGENQMDWFLNALRTSTAKWKVIVSSVVFNPSYALTLNNDSIMAKYPWMRNDVIDKWAGFQEDLNKVMTTIKDNNIRNVFVISGDTHSSYIDDGNNSLLPEISASNLDVPNSKLAQRIEPHGLNIWNQGSYPGDGHTYGKVSFVYGEEDYVVMEIIDERGKVVVSYKLMAQ